MNSSKMADKQTFGMSSGGIRGDMRAKTARSSPRSKYLQNLQSSFDFVNDKTKMDIDSTENPDRFSPIRRVDPNSMHRSASSHTGLIPTSAFSARSKAFLQNHQPA
jgi:hypothetical protein